MKLINDINSYDIEQGYFLIKNIIDYVIKRDNVKFSTSKNAPNNYKEMVSYFETNKEFLIFDGGDHGHLGEKYNVRFRALHDKMHYDKKLSFSFQDEKILSDITVNMFRKLAYNKFYATHWEMAIVGEIINAEIRGQIEYYELNKSYVEDQKQFINDYLEVS